MRRTVSYLFPLILLFSSVSFGQLWSGIISPSRAVDWSQVGISGGIPSGNWTQCGATIAAGASAATINAALSACPANHYVQLGAGTFNLSAGIVSHTSHVELRGMGADQTFLVFSGTNGCSGVSANICFMSQDINYYGSPTNIANWTAGYAAGSTSITLSSKTNLQVGWPLTLDQADDTSDNGDIFVCYTPQGTCSSNGDNGGFMRAGRSQEQIVTVTSISGSGPYTIGISPAIYMPNWTSGKSPQAWWPTSPVFGAGVASLSIDSTKSGANDGVQVFNCSGCWVKGIRSIDPMRAHVMAWQSPRAEIVDSYFFNTQNHTSTSYGVELANTSDSLAQNNIFQQTAEPLPLNGICSGCVVAYNFDINNIFDGGGGVFTWQMQGLMTHAVGNEHILVEGNQGAGMYSDNFHGSHHFVTAFRNAWNGYQKNNGSNTSGGIGAVKIFALSRFYNIVGNVLGTSALPYTHYQQNLSNAASVANNSAVEVIGVGDGVPDDPNVSRTLLNWGNYDTVTGAVRWCGNSSSPGWSTTCGGVSEVPSGIANFANPVPASTTLPPSFYLGSKPNWWPDAKPWPPIGPDVTGGNLNAGVGGHANTVPAADCYANVMNGPADGTGGVLSFNDSNCYTTSASSGGGSGAPLPPSGLSVVVN